MNAVTHTLRRPGRRIAELDFFGVEAEVAPAAGYGCVDWYVYADAHTRQTQPRVSGARPLLVAPRAPQALSERH
jgi:hypothetical protein